MLVRDKKNNKILARRGLDGQQTIERGNAGQKKISKFVFYMLLVFFVSISIYSIFFSGFMQINRILVQGEKDLDPDKISVYAQSLFSGKILNVISRNNYILISKKNIEKKVLDQFKKINRVEVKKSFPNLIYLSITERKSILLWCSAQNCYYIDEQGIAYEQANLEAEGMENMNLVKLSDSSEKAVQTGEKILDSQSVEFISAIKSELENDLDIAVTVDFWTSSRIAQDFQVQTLDGTKIFFSLTENMKDELEKLKIFFEKEFKKEDISKIEYIDLRSENRVYYKLKGEEVKEGENQETQVQGTETQKTDPVKEEKKKDDKKKN